MARDDVPHWGACMVQRKNTQEVCIRNNQKKEMEKSQSTNTEYRVMMHTDTVRSQQKDGVR